MRCFSLAMSILVCGLLLSPVAAYKGSQLSRTPLPDFELLDQHGTTYSFSNNSHEIIVVSFIFTRCTDVCPVITQLLKTVDESLSETEQNDVTFISISVDPEYDTPERLMEFTQLHGVNWPHLTGTVEEMIPIWAMFGVVVQKNVIDAHHNTYNPHAASLTIVNETGIASGYMFDFDFFNLISLASQSMEWNLTIDTTSQSINEGSNTESLMTYKAVNNSWLNMTSIEFNESVLDGGDYLITPSTVNASTVSLPEDSGELSVTFAKSNNTISIFELDDFTGYHLTQSTLTANHIPYSIESSTYGHYLQSINGTMAPSDFSWWWNLYAWNESANSWESSEVGMDEILEPTHLAWAPSTQNISEIPSPVASSNVSSCNGHGWVMGSGDGQHCMCDAGYEWADDDVLTCVEEQSQEYSVGHSTITYILNRARQPVIAWAGESWKPDDVTSDIRELLRKERLGDEVGNTPSLSFLVTSSTVVGAAVIFRYTEHPEGNRRGEREKTTTSPHRIEQSSHSLVLRRI